jgi:hypothetical protein
MQPSVLIIGAGLAGLLAGRSLAAAGWRVAILDKGRGPGGRLATRRIGGASFDSGAQFFSVREPAFGALVDEWQRAGLARPWSTGFASDDPRLGGVATLTPAEDGFARYLVAGGMNRLAKHLAAGLDVQCGVTITRLDVEPGRVLAVAGGEPVERRFEAGAAIITAPVPQTLALLDAGRQSSPLAAAQRGRLEAVRYAPCMCLLLDYPDAAGAALPPPGGVRLLHGPIQWLASQRAKGLRGAGEGLVVHAAPDWSAGHVALADAELGPALLHEARAAIARLCGSGWEAPAEVQLKRWSYSLATATIAEPCLRAALGAPVVFAGDAFGGKPRVEGAALSGLAAAQALIASAG